MYLSNYGDVSSISPSQMIDTLGRFPAWKFEVFCAVPPPEASTRLATNVTVRSFSVVDFLDVLRHCDAIIGTAGHNLVSEAVQLGIPMLAAPLAMYDQQYSAHVIHREGIGCKMDGVDPDMVDFFLSNLEQFRAASHANSNILKSRQSDLDDLCRRLVTL